MNDVQEMFAWLIEGIAYCYLEMPEGKERDEALEQLASTGCLSPRHLEQLHGWIAGGEAGAPGAQYDLYDLQDALIDEIILSGKPLEEWNFREELYRALMAFVYNPLCPLDRPTCDYGIREDMDDYSFGYVKKLRGEE